MSRSAMESRSEPKPQKRRGAVERLFDRIAPTYDRLNRILSFNADGRWRRRALEELHLNDGDLVLDVATGTGDMAILAGGAAEVTIVGIDLSTRMMKEACEKWGREQGGSQYLPLRGDALAMPFPDQVFENAMVAFGIRNIANVSAFLREVNRVLRPGGRMAVVELSLPRDPLLNTLVSFYLVRILPLLAKMEGGDPRSYRYLSESILRFPQPSAVEAKMAECGFSVVSSVEMTFGACHLYVIAKPKAGARMAGA